MKRIFLYFAAMIAAGPTLRAAAVAVSPAPHIPAQKNPKREKSEANMPQKAVLFQEQRLDEGRRLLRFSKKQRASRWIFVPKKVPLWNSLRTKKPLYHRRIGVERYPE